MNASHVCAYYWSRACAYVARETRTWEPGRLGIVFAMTPIRTQDRKINDALLADDPEALKEACRDWWAAILRETPSSGVPHADPSQ